MKMPRWAKLKGTLTQWTNERQGLHRLFDRHGRQPPVYGLLSARVGFVLEFVTLQHLDTIMIRYLRRKL